MQCSTVKKFRVTVSFPNGSNSVVDENNFQCLNKTGGENLKCEKLWVHTLKPQAVKEPKI